MNSFPDPAVWSIPLGAALDFAVGDPRGWPHPVRAVGRLIAGVERALRFALNRRERRPSPLSERIAGVVLAAVVVALVGASAWGLVAIGDRLGGPWSLLVRSLLIFWGLAIRSLRDEALLASEAVDIAIARSELALIVGRDTADLDRPAICRACVETVAENANDGAIAAIFWLAIGGPVALWIYKAINTLDSMVGYRDERYVHLGRASARLDDAACFFPARLSWLLIALAAWFARERPKAALRIGWRDGRNHPSPNSAWSEAAMAGALGVQLGGPAAYRGVARPRPVLGDPGDPIGPETVRRAIRVMMIAAVFALALAWSVRAWVVPLLPRGSPAG